MSDPFIVAEMSANHLGSLERALAIVDAAANAGADAIKLQTWRADTMCVDKNYVLNGSSWSGKKLFDLYREAHLPWEYHSLIFDRCKELGISCFSAPFDRESVDFLETLGCPMYKIASFEITDFPLIKYAASKGKPMIISTGVANYSDIHKAYVSAGFNGLYDVTLLKCTSDYPADASDANLAVMKRLQNQFLCKVGISDHSLGIGVAVAATTLGASMIEKHLTLSRSDGGPDAGFSMEPPEFKQMVIECRRAAASIGTDAMTDVSPKLAVLRRSLWAVKDISEGDILTEENVRTARPALGISPSHLHEVMGRVVKKTIKAGTPLSWEMI